MTVYDNGVLKMPTNQSQSPVNAPIILDAFFEEGAITVSSARTVSNGSVMLEAPHYTWDSGRVDFADNPTAPDFVTLATSDAAYTYAALQGKPILVLKGTNTNPIVGVLGSDLRGPLVAPATTAAADTVAERVAGLYLRHGQVTLFGFAYYPVLCKGNGTAIAVGDHLVYDNSEAKWVKEASTTLSPVVACHVATGASDYVGALIYGPPITQS